LDKKLLILYTALVGKYTTLCDVWSYGVLAWEIFAKGGVPYNGLSNSQARERIDEGKMKIINFEYLKQVPIISGYRMPAADGTPSEMYQIMLKCWEYKPENRPKFEEIFRLVNQMYEASKQTAM